MLRYALCWRLIAQWALPWRYGQWLGGCTVNVGCVILRELLNLSVPQL